MVLLLTNFLATYLPLHALACGDAQWDHRMMVVLIFLNVINTRGKERFQKWQILYVRFFGGFFSIFVFYFFNFCVNSTFISNENLKKACSFLVLIFCTVIRVQTTINLILFQKPGWSPLHQVTQSKLTLFIFKNTNILKRIL